MEKEGDVISIIEKLLDKEALEVIGYANDIDRITSAMFNKFPTKHELILATLCNRLANYISHYQGDRDKLFFVFEKILTDKLGESLWKNK